MIKDKKIVEAHVTIGEAQAALEAAQEAHTTAIMEEASRLIAERQLRDEKRDKAAEKLRAVADEKKRLEADEERHYASYQRACYQGDEDAAKLAQDMGEVARFQLEEASAKEEEARRKLEGATFDEIAADDTLRANLSALKGYAPSHQHEELDRLIGIEMGSLRREMRGRAEAAKDPQTA